MVFSTPGVETVTLQVCNAGGCSSASKTLVVLDPRPVISGLQATPARLEQGQILQLEAVATGQAPLNYSWQIVRGGVVVGTVFGAHATWPTAGEPVGSYAANLQVSNGAGTASGAVPFSVVASTPTRFYTVAPCRVFDTRLTHQPLSRGAPPVLVPVGGACGVPTSAQAVATNLTVVKPTVGGSVAVYPADFAQATVPSIQFAAGAIRANNAVLPLSTDGTARLAALASLSGTGSVDLVVDVFGYFASPAGSPPVAVEFQARLCPFGFCEFAAGTDIFFTQDFAGGPPTEYRYDWTGAGVFSERSPTPIKSHVYASAVGMVRPAVQIVMGAQVSTLSQATPIYIEGAGTPLPDIPAGVTARFAGYVTASVVDPTLSGLLPSYQLAVGNAPPNLLGYNVYASRDGGAYTLVAALDPALPASEPLVVAPFSPPADSVRIEVAAVSFAGEGPRAPPFLLPPP